MSWSEVSLLMPYLFFSVILVLADVPPLEDMSDLLEQVKEIQKTKSPSLKKPLTSAEDIKTLNTETRSHGLKLVTFSFWPRRYKPRVSCSRKERHNHVTRYRIDGIKCYDRSNIYMDWKNIQILFIGNVDNTPLDKASV